MRAHDDAAAAAASCVHRTRGSGANAANALGSGDTRRLQANDARRRACPCRWPVSRCDADAGVAVAAADAAAVRQRATVACVAVAVADCGGGDVGVVFVVVGV